mmetsp:Transcript_22961/g.53721  ORF Transcript_22961/g.53721 Transcript_22961/m.53721 type:complete len:204 (-) Transcript_22961:307-918(-)
MELSLCLDCLSCASFGSGGLSLLAFCLCTCFCSRFAIFLSCSLRLRLGFGIRGRLWNAYSCELCDFLSPCHEDFDISLLLWCVAEVALVSLLQKGFPCRQSGSRRSIVQAEAEMRRNVPRHHHEAGALIQEPPEGAQNGSELLRPGLWAVERAWCCCLRKELFNLSDGFGSYIFQLFLGHVALGLIDCHLQIVHRCCFGLRLG